MLQIDESQSSLLVSLINSYVAFYIFLFSFLHFFFDSIVAVRCI